MVTNLSAPAEPPVPVLPAHPNWVAAYWQSWHGNQNDVLADQALTHVRSLRARGMDDEAFATACEFMNRAGQGIQAHGARSSSVPADRWPTVALLLIEEIIGVTWSAEGVQWKLRLEPTVALHGLEIDGTIISLTAETDTGAGLVVVINAGAPFDLTIATQFTTFQERVPSDRTRYLLTYLDRTDILTDQD